MKKAWISVILAAVFVMSGVAPKMVHSRHQANPKGALHFELVQTGAGATIDFSPCGSDPSQQLSNLDAEYGVNLVIDYSSYTCGSSGCAFDVYNTYPNNQFWDYGICNY